MGSNAPTPILLALALAGLLSACDKPDAANDSPPITMGGAARDSAPSAAEAAEAPTDPSAPSAPNAGAADGNAPSANPDAPAPARPSGQLPGGTPEQKEALMEAKLAFVQERLVEAEDRFKAIAESEPVSGESVSAAIALGQIYTETGRQQQALTLYTNLRERVAGLPEVLLVLARTLADMNRPEEAIATYEQALEGQPDYIFLLTELAQLHLEQGRKERASELLYTYEQRVHTLANRLEDHSAPAEDRLYLVDVFGFVDDDRAYRALMHALDDPYPQIRRAAATTLGEVRLDDARNLLQRVAIEDDATEVRMAARQALRLINEEG
ncbi:hypothetical protein DL240_17670 [Lujinxingia litoralis]|uniref:Uncharacterized protein n=1 Tax=Lujinxingia litoralis TaxID=2211119 RepID=A0A328C335_9DELT|nr:tetratricopeptide repeat protein [Lujinxingia litoralis]RAL20211.1 hypothetical protein DL240_17670 [Lujinxingia litoralis]